MHLAVIVTARFCTAVGSGCSGLLGNDYRSVRGINKSFYSLDRRAENAPDLASAKKVKRIG